MIKNYFLTVMAFVFCGGFLDAQTPSFVWVQQGATSNNGFYAATGRRIVSDSLGYTYVIGDFDGPSLTLGNNLVLPAPSGNNGQFFVAKYDPLGNVVWAQVTTKCRSLGTGVALDGNGKVYVVGTFTFPNPYNDTASFGGFNFAKSNGTMFLAQLETSNGHVNWMQQAVADQSGSNSAQGSAIAVYGNNEIYVSGAFQGTVNFGGTKRTALGYFDAYLIKYNNTGNMQWVQTAGANNGMQAGFNGLTTDGNGNVYVSGSYQVKLYIGTDTLNSLYNRNIMLAKFDAAGNYKWSRSSGGTASTLGVSKMTHDNRNNIYVVGLFAVNNGTITFGNQTLNNTTGNYITFLVRYDTLGNLAWLKSPGGGFNAYTNPGIDFDNHDNMYMTGAFYGNVSFGSTTLTSSVNGNTDDIYIAKFDSTINPVWAKQAGGNYNDETGDVAADKVGNVFITGNSSSGNVNENVYFDTVTVNVPSNQKYAFVAKIGTVPAAIDFTARNTTICQNSTVNFTSQPGGTPLAWSWTFTGGTPGNSTGQYPSITYPTAGNFAVKLVVTTASGTDSITKAGYITVMPAPVAGTIHATPDTICSGQSVLLSSDSLTGSTIQWQSAHTPGNFSNALGGDTADYQTPMLFETTLYRLVAFTGSCSDTSTALRVVVNSLPSPPVLSANATLICSSDSSHIETSGLYTSYLWNNGDITPGTTAKAAGGYWVTVADANGCTAVSEHLNINVYAVPSVSIVVQGDTLASFNATSYQWYRDDTLIPGATSSVYIANISGDYSVQIVDSNGCKAISNNVSVVISGLASITENSGVVVYPNPFSNSIFISANNIAGIEVYDVTGRIVFSGNHSATGSRIGVDLSDLVKGMYCLKIRTAEANFFKPIIKQ